MTIKYTESGLTDPIDVKEYVSLLIGLYKNSGSVLCVSN